MARAKHRSACCDLDRSLRWLESFEEVKKLVLGLTENCRHKYTPGHIRFKSNVSAGIKVNGYSGNGVIDIFIRIEPDDVEFIKTKIIERFK